MRANMGPLNVTHVDKTEMVSLTYLAYLLIHIYIYILCV